MRSPIYSNGGVQRRTLFGVGGWYVSQASGRQRCVDDLPTQLARDELQTTMIAETNRKRRKLERDRRAAERPQPGKLRRRSAIIYVVLTSSSAPSSSYPTRDTYSANPSRDHQQKPARFFLWSP